MTIDKHSLDNVAVIIPVRDEEITIKSVIKSLQFYGLQNILVVDNGSKDSSTAQAEAVGAKVVSEPIPGYGRACWRGLQHLNFETEWILFCDGDGSDELQQIPNLLAKRAEFDLILGNRRATTNGRKAMTPIQNFGNGLATFLMGLGWGHWYQDLGPLRLIRSSALAQINMQDRGFGWTVEMQARAIECGLRICEIPVGYHPRQGGRSKISGTLSGSIRAGTIILATLGKLYLQSIIRFLKEVREERTGNSGETPRRRQTQGKAHQEREQVQEITEIIPKKNFYQRSILVFLSSLLLIVGAVLIVPYGDFFQVEAVPHFLVGIAVMSVGFIISWTLHSVKAFWFWAVAILVRLILIPMHPGDDIWRYLWEGYIQLQGISPYDFAPNAPELMAYRTEWWSKMNHLDVSAIYPPITQLGFRFLAFFTPSITLFKLAFIGADLLVCWLLSRRFGYQKTILYAWNPLVIYSFAGGAHYDSWFILPLVAAWLIFDYGKGQKRYLVSALLIGVSVAIKWMSLPILSFLIWRAFRKVGVLFALVILVCGCLPLVISSIPFCNDLSCPLIPTDSGFVSQGRSAELIPYLVGRVWQESITNNSFFAIPLGLTVIVLVLCSKNLEKFTEWYLIGVVILSPIVHAWYLTWFIPFAVASRNLGIRLISLSAFAYFALLYRQAQGMTNWMLTDQERLWLWLPFIFGVLVFLIRTYAAKSKINMTALRE